MLVRVKSDEVDDGDEPRMMTDEGGAVTLRNYGLGFLLKS